MDYVTRQFINLTKKLRKEFRLSLDRFHDDLKNQTSAIRHAADTYEASKSPSEPILVSAKLDSVSSIETRKPAEEKEADSDYQFSTLLVQWLMLLATVGAFVSAAIYAAIAAKQLHQMRIATQASENAAITAAQALEENKKQFSSTVSELKEQTRAQREAARASTYSALAARESVEQFKNAQSSWLTIENASMTQWPNDPKMHFDLFNRGASIALNVVAASFGQGGPNFNPGASWDWVGINMKNSPVHSAPDGFTIAPGDHHAFDSDVLNRGQPYRQVTVWRIAWKDIFGREHRTHFCYFVSHETSRVRGCPQSIDWGDE